MDSSRKIIAWYDRRLRLWTAVFHDSDGNQVGAAGYGMNKQQALEDLKYQDRIGGTK